MIVPAPLNDDADVLAQQLSDLTMLQPKPERIQIDILDGEYAPHLTVDLETALSLDAGNVLRDFHFMTVEPVNDLDLLEGQPRIGVAIAQIERMSDPVAYVERAAEIGIDAGFSLDRYTPVATLEDPDMIDLLPRLKVVQLMGGVAGEQGQAFQPAVLEKIRELRSLRQTVGASFVISVDIGMNPETIPEVRDAGAEWFAVGSFLLHNSDIQEQWEKLLKSDI